MINLWTREVNDIRDGLFADLDITPAGPRPGRRPARGRAPGLADPDGLPGVAGPAGLADGAGDGAAMPDRRRTRRCATPRSSFACCTRTWACSARSGSTAWRNTTASGSTSTSSGSSRPTPGGSSPSGRLNPSTILLFGAALAIALGLLGYNVVVSEQIAIAHDADPAGRRSRAWPIRSSEWIRHRKAIRQANRSARGIFEFLERKPELHQNVGAHFLKPLKEQIALEHVALESRSGRGPARRRLGRDPGRVADRDPGPRRRLEAGPGLPDPPADRPQVRPRPDRRPRPPRRRPSTRSAPRSPPSSRPTWSSPTRCW